MSGSNPELGMLNYKQDWRSVVFVIVCLGLILLPYRIDIPASYTPVWLMLAGLFCFCACIINHNHVHTATFQQAALNRLFGVLLTLAKGHTSAGVILAHNYNHHVYNGKSNDWIRPELAGNGPGIIRLIRFIINSVVSMTRGKREQVDKVLPVEVVRQMRLERIALFTFIVFLVVLDMRTFLMFVLIPWMTGVLLLIGVNLLQHDKCEPDSAYNHSRNFTSKLGNWFFFNNGYHTAHHMYPGLHWSELPDLHHRKVVPFIDKRLDKKSIMSFMIKNYTL